MSRILIVYATQRKNTEKIAFFIGQQLEQQGCQVALYDVEKIPSELHLNDYDGLIVGAPVMMGKFSPLIRKWVHRNAPYFYSKSIGFFSVCLGILDKNPKTQKNETKILKDFLSSTKLDPDVHAIFAGALNYSKYNVFLKLVMWWIAWRSGSQTSILKDYEYTDWKQVERFCESFVKDLRFEEKCERMTLV